VEGSRALGSAASRCIGLYGNIPTMGVYSGLNLALGSQQTSLGLIVANGHAIKKLSTRTVAPRYPGWPKFKESVRDSELSGTVS